MSERTHVAFMPLPRSAKGRLGMKRLRDLRKAHGPGSYVAEITEESTREGMNWGLEKENKIKPGFMRRDMYDIFRV